LGDALQGCVELVYMFHDVFPFEWRKPNSIQPASKEPWSVQNAIPSIHAMPGFAN